MCSLFSCGSAAELIIDFKKFKKQNRLLSNNLKTQTKKSPLKKAGLTL